jgi:hypothetical protein
MIKVFIGLLTLEFIVEIHKNEGVENSLSAYDLPPTMFTTVKNDANDGIYLIWSAYT